MSSKLFSLVKIILSYVDVVRDTVLVGLLITIVGFKGSFWEDITLFPKVVTLILVATVAVPLFVSAVQLSCRHPLMIFKLPVWKEYRTNPASGCKLAFIQS